MKKIMKRAWEIYRTLTTGTRLEKLSIALKKAWSEVKTMVKKIFEKIAVVARCENPDPESRCEYVTFKAWEKGDKKRIYISDYKNRTLGYIDRVTVETIINDNQGMHQHEVDYALNAFFNTYAI